MKPLIGVTSEEVTRDVGKWTPLVHGQNSEYTDAIIRAGGLPVILPMTRDASVRRQYYERCDGFLFTGGNDIHPKRYGKGWHEKLRDVHDLRDEQELALMEMALAGNKPVLAICRGMQMLNVHRGGTLHQHLPENIAEVHEHDVGGNPDASSGHVHTLKVAPGSRLHEVLGTEQISANSRHHQAIDLLGDDLVVVAWAEDGIIEAVELPNHHFVIGLQLHPESMESFTEPRWRKVFEAFVASAKAPAAVEPREPAFETLG